MQSPIDKNLIDKIRHAAREQEPWVIDLRRHLHQNPELSFHEKETSAFIRKQLEEIGIACKTIGETGITGQIKGAGPGKNILLRADIDALPIQEQSEKGYRSGHPDVMHACGHDGHTSMLLLAAKLLVQLQKEWKGTVRILFQPAEEVIPGGALSMIKEGILSPAPDFVIGQHVMPRLACGKVGIRAGKFMASSDHLIIHIHGKGGHAAMPEAVVDPVVIAANIITALQQIVSRRAGPKMPSVLSIGKMATDGSYNVIPNEVLLEGTFRTLDEGWRSEAHKRITSLIHHLADSMGAHAEVEIRLGNPYLHNNEALSGAVKAYMADYLGRENVVDEEIWMASEDFAYYAQKAPSVFYLLGVGNKAKGIDSGLHTPTFDIDEDCLSQGGGLMAWLAMSLGQVSYTFEV